jgi:hypothetical protein
MPHPGRLSVSTRRPGEAAFLHSSSKEAFHYASSVCVQASKGARIRQGSPEEEAALASHIGALAPTHASLAALGELSEALVLLGHAEDARLLQAAMAALVAAQEVRGMSLATCYGTPECMHVACSPSVLGDANAVLAILLQTGIAALSCSRTGAWPAVALTESSRCTLIVAERCLGCQTCHRQSLAECAYIAYACTSADAWRQA